MYVASWVEINGVVFSLVLKADKIVIRPFAHGNKPLRKNKLIVQDNIGFY